MTDLLVLDDQMIITLARNPEFVREFPILQQAVRPAGVASLKKRRCNDCNSPLQGVVSNLNGIKYALTQLGADRKKKLLEMLNTRQVRVQVSVDSKVVRYTISS